MTEDPNHTIHPDDLEAALDEFRKHIEQSNGSYAIETALRASIVVYERARRLRLLGEIAAMDAEFLGIADD